MRDTTNVYELFCVLCAVPQDRFLVPCVLNHLMVEVVIMYEAKRFSRAIKDKIIVRKYNQIAKRV